MRRRDTEPEPQPTRKRAKPQMTAQRADKTRVAQSVGFVTFIGRDFTVGRTWFALTLENGYITASLARRVAPACAAVTH